MQELIEFIVKSIVDNKDLVNVEVKKEEKATQVVVSVADGDLGHVIGKGGNIAQSIRTIVKSAYPHQRTYIKFEAK